MITQLVRRPRTTDLVFRQASFNEIIWLRDELCCRPFGLPIEYPLDRQDDTQHIGVFWDEQPIASVTIWPTHWLEEVPAWQVFGLVVQPDLRRRGLGRSLLEYSIELVRHDYSRRWMWTHVPLSQVELYKAIGFERLRDIDHHSTLGPLVELVMAI